MHKISRALAFASLLALGVQSAASADWLLPRQNAALNPVVETPIRHFHWQYPIPGGSVSTPVVDKDRVYVAGSNDQLYALHLYTGTLDWSLDVGNQLLASPLVYRGIVIASTGNLNAGQHGAIGSGISSLVGIDAETGKQVWWYGIDGTGAASGAIIGGRYVHHDGAGDLVALNPRSGAVIWKSNIGTHAALSAVTPVSSSSAVTAGRDPNEVVRFNAANGHVMWRTRLPADALGVSDVPLAADADAVYGAYAIPKKGGTWSEHAYSLSVSDGRKLWDTELQGGAPLTSAYVGAVPLIDGERMYVGNPLAPYMNALDKRTGKLVWNLHASAPVASGSALKAGVLYFGDNGGDLWAVRAQSGKSIGYVGVGDPIDRAAPTIAGETLLITSRNGYAIAELLSAIQAGSGP